MCENLTDEEMLERLWKASEGVHVEAPRGRIRWDMIIVWGSIISFSIGLYYVLWRLVSG